MDQETKTSVAAIGAIMSDLVAHTHAFVTENETGELLNQRLLEIRAAAGSLLRHVETVASKRRT